MSYLVTVEEWIKDAAQDSLFGTIYADIDALNVHNSCLGHLQCDQTIAVISECLKSVLPSGS